MHNRIKQILFVIITIFLALAVIEFSFRVMYSIKRRNLKYMTFGLRDVFKFDVDHFHGYIKLKKPGKWGDKIHHGFRTGPFTIEKPGNEYRIVVMGGSSVYGAYGRYRESWPYLLEQILNRELGDYNYKVINTGLVGQTTYGIDRLLKAEVLDWNPDVIIIYSLFNHTNIDTVAVYKEECRADSFFRFIKALFYEKSLLITFLMDRIRARPEGLLRNKMDTYRYLLSDIIKNCNEKNVDVIIVKQLIKPGRFVKIRSNDTDTRYVNVAAPGQYRAFLNIIDVVRDEHDCTVIDFSAFSPLCKGRVDTVLEDKKVHLSDFGKKLLAETIAEKIIEMRKHQ